MTPARPVIALLAFAALGACASHETLQASFDHSEWHPSSMLKLDVANGGFVAEFRDGTVASGRFSAAETRRIQDMIVAARAAGLADPVCVNTPPRQRQTIVISNGGTPTLVLRGAGEERRVPEDLACWTPEATALHDFINETLDARGDEWTMPRQRTHFGLAG